MTGDDRLAMRVWERGAGETQSCGTGACASAAVAHRRGLVGEQRARRRARRHRSPSRSGATVRLGGPVVHVFDVVMPREPLLESLARPDRMTPPRAQAGRQRRRLTATEVDLERLRQRALLVGAGAGADSVEDAEASLEELALLADTAGAEPVESVLQRRRTPDPDDLRRQGQGRGAARARATRATSTS